MRRDMSSNFVGLKFIAQDFTVDADSQLADSFTESATNPEHLRLHTRSLQQV